MRRFVIGDIHGCSKALRTLIEAIEPTAEDELIFLGDYIDRGPDSKDVVDQILQLKQRCQVKALRGNHEIMLVGVALHGLEDEIWLENGGSTTVASYGGKLDKIPESHLDFFQQLLAYYETDDAIFVHAGYGHLAEMDDLDDTTLYWKHLPFPLPLPHKSGKRVFLGHTPQAEGDILEREHLVCLDTYCFGGGYLTAYDIDSGAVIQADRQGHLRRRPIVAIIERLTKLLRR